MRGTIEKLPSGSFRISIYLGKDPTTGKKIRARKTVEASTKKEADRELTKMLRDLDAGAYVEPAKDTMLEYLERWLRDCVVTEIEKPSTRRSYEMIVRRHLIPALGHHKLARLTPALVQTYCTTKLGGGRIDAQRMPTGKPLSQTTVPHHHAVLHDALKFAVRLGLVGRNVTDAADPPKIRRSDFHVWSDDDVRRFLVVSHEHRYYSLLLLALTTGMRAGELFGLRWEDVDLAGGALTVNQTLQKPGPKPQFGRSKSNASRRTVTLST